MARLGVRTVDELVGRTDLSEDERASGCHPREQKRVDLSATS